MEAVNESDTTALLQRYGAPPYTVMATLQDGAEVVGDGVDQANRLLYVIKRGETLSVEYAENQPVVITRRTVTNVGRVTSE